ncbi:hypothetical protein LIER_14481 [Lithospermum erythrorhizon]|uniref:Uncharacterized protein n=1 Tax=Lithospermum erythrorhizon TaxID=34254 RepID=A0AAV3Q1P1_LITER
MYLHLVLKRVNKEGEPRDLVHSQELFGVEEVGKGHLVLNQRRRAQGPGTFPRRRKKRSVPHEWGQQGTSSMPKSSGQKEEISSQRRLGKASLLQSPAFPAQSSLASRRSPANPTHEELISSFSALGDKALKKEKAQEKGALQRPLRNLSGEHNTLQERYATSIRRTEAVKAELEGMHAKRDFALLERDAIENERESLRASRDEML